MPKKKTVAEPKGEVYNASVDVAVSKTVPLEPVVEAPKESELVKIRIKVGSLSFEEGTFQKDSIVTVPKKRLNQFDPSDYEVVA